MDLQMIQQNALFRGIEKEDLERMLICSKSKYKRYASGTTIFRQDEEADRLYALLKGRVVIVHNMASGKRNILYEVERNSVFGEYHFKQHYENYRYDAEASTAVELLEIPWEFFHCFCDAGCLHHQKLVQNMLDIVVKKEWQAAKKLYIVNSPSLKERLSLWLLEEADENGRIELKMNREELADFLGVARPSLSRTLMQLQAEGAIQAGKKEILILDWEKIRNLGN